MVSDRKKQEATTKAAYLTLMTVASLGLAMIIVGWGFMWTDLACIGIILLIIGGSGAWVSDVIKKKRGEE